MTNIVRGRRGAKGDKGDQGDAGNDGQDATLPATATQAEMQAGTEAGLRMVSPELVRDGVDARVPPVFRTGNNDIIDSAKLPPHDDSGHGGQSAAQVAAAIQTHTEEADAHHTPPTVPQDYDSDVDSTTTNQHRTFSPANVASIAEEVVEDDVEDWARDDSTPIPANKLGNAPSSPGQGGGTGLTASQAAELESGRRTGEGATPGNHAG